MAKRSETAVGPYQELLTGHFHAETDYFTYRSHGTRDWLLIHTLSGIGRFGFTGGEIIAEPGDLVLLRPGTLHDYGLVPDRPRWELLWTHFIPRPGWHDWLSWPKVPDTELMRLRLSRADSDRVKARFLEVHELASGPRRNRTSLAMNALEEVLLWCDELSPARQAAVDPRIQAALELMCRKLDEPLPIEKLADLAGLSASRFSHLFQQLVGTTPQRYHEQRRLDRACRLLEMTSMPMKTIARELGFDNAFYFSRRFSLHSGCSPSEYRRRMLRKRNRNERSRKVGDF